MTVQRCSRLQLPPGVVHQPLDVGPLPLLGHRPLLAARAGPQPLGEQRGAGGQRARVGLGHPHRGLDGGGGRVEVLSSVSKTDLLSCCWGWGWGAAARLLREAPRLPRTLLGRRPQAGGQLLLQMPDEVGVVRAPRPRGHAGVEDVGDDLGVHGGVEHPLLLQQPLDLLLLPPPLRAAPGGQHPPLPAVLPLDGLGQRLDVHRHEGVVSFLLSLIRK